MPPILLLSVLLASPAHDALWVEAPPHAPAVTLPSIAPIVDATLPALLEVRTAPAALPPGHPPIPGDDLRGEATGFVIHPSGLALTNQHVVGCEATVPVRVGTAPEAITARVLARDAAADLALLQLPPRDDPWPHLPLGDSTALRVGDFVVAVGNPFGLSHSVSLGILSGRDRPPERASEYAYLQTDAAINPGNSGGPILDLAGRVVGIATAIHRQGSGIGYAIPIDAVKLMLPGMKAQGRLVRGWLGVAIRDVARGVEIVRLDATGPAAQAGLKVGDVIRTFEGRPVDSTRTLQGFAGLGRPGNTVELHVARGEALEALPVTLGARPDPGDDACPRRGFFDRMLDGLRPQ